MNAPPLTRVISMLRGLFNVVAIVSGVSVNWKLNYNFRKLDYIFVIIHRYFLKLIFRKRKYQKDIKKFLVNYFQFFPLFIKN